MHLVGLHAVAQRGIDLLVALNGALAFKGSRHNGGKPVATIALERDGKLRAGVIFDPIRNELFWAEEGGGAWLDNRRLRVGARRKLGEAVVTTGIPQLGVSGGEKFLDELTRVRNEVAAVRRFGSAALDLAWVAAGRFDGFWERGLSLWDIAAGFVLMQEAGGIVTGLDKTDATKGSFVASNTSLAPKLIELVEGKLRKPAAGTRATLVKKP